MLNFVLQEFNLIERRELAPLQELIEKLTAKDARWVRLLSTSHSSSRNFSKESLNHAVFANPHM